MEVLLLIAIIFCRIEGMRSRVVGVRAEIRDTNKASRQDDGDTKPCECFCKFMHLHTEEPNLAVSLLIGLIFLKPNITSVSNKTTDNVQPSIE